MFCVPNEEMLIVSFVVAVRAATGLFALDFTGFGEGINCFRVGIILLCTDEGVVNEVLDEIVGI